MVLTDEDLRSIDHRQEEDASNESIASVVDRNRPGICNFKRVLLWEEKKQSLVEGAKSVTITFVTKKEANIEQDRAC